jgi:predicted ester cyclase
MTQQEQANIDAVRRFYGKVFSGNRLDLLPAFVVENVLLNPGGERGIKAYQTQLNRAQTAFSDGRFSIESIIAGDDLVAVRWKMDAIHSGPIGGLAATGKPIRQNANVFFRFEQGKIAEVWTQFDQIGVPRQLGFDPLQAAQQQQHEAGAAQ